LKHPVVGAPSRRPRKPRSSIAGNFLDPLACVRTTSTTTSPPKRDHPRAGLHKPHRHHCVHERIPHRIHSSVWVHKGLTLEIVCLQRKSSLLPMSTRFRRPSEFLLLQLLRRDLGFKRRSYQQVIFRSRWTRICILPSTSGWATILASTPLRMCFVSGAATGLGGITGPKSTKKGSTFLSESDLSKTMPGRTLEG